jgi:tetratricopeptide (TPR) repeat protein
MRRLLVALSALCLVISSIPAAEPQNRRTLVLRGSVVPPVRHAVAALAAVETPFRTQGHVFRGKFRFTGLAAGTYKLTVYHPQWGATQKTIAVTPSFADKKGRVEITFALEESPEERERHLLDRNTVTVKELSVSPQAEKQFREGRKKLGGRKVSAAIQHLKKAVEISPEYVDAWNELGTIAYQTGEYEQAEGYFRQALRHDPGAFAPVVNLGGTLLSLGRFDDALAYNLQAVELQPEDALANSQTGMNYFYFGKFPEALKYLTAAKQLDPAHFSQPQIFLAEIHGRMGRPRQAIGELRDFLDRHPDSPRSAQVRQTIARLERATKEEGRMP